MPAQSSCQRSFLWSLPPWCGIAALKSTTGEIRVSILWEWLHKGGSFTEDDPATGVRAGDPFTRELFDRLLAEEYEKLRRADTRDVYDASKDTTLPVAREIVRTVVTDPVKAPWYIDLLNITLDSGDLENAQRRIRMYMDAFRRDGTRITGNLDFDAAPAGARNGEA